MSHALQGEINFIEEILEDHPFGDDIFIPQLKGEKVHKQLIWGGRCLLWIYLDHNTDKFICGNNLEDVLPQLPNEVIKQLHAITLEEYAL